MKVKELIKYLEKENQEEEVVFILNDNRTEYHVIEYRPFLHAGPSRFTDREGKTFTSSVVIARIKKP